MQNDGGSHTDIYYQIDFNKGTSVKCADIYAGLEGYVYTGKVLFSKKLNEITKRGISATITFSPANIAS